MLTPFSKWMIYSASYLPIYLILLVRVLLDGIGDMSFEECMRQNFAKHIIVIVLLLLLTIISVMTVLSFKKIKPTEKYSLQGTTQGRYLTGGVPPVRFSM